MSRWSEGVKVTTPGTVSKLQTQEHICSKEIADICLNCDKPDCKKGICSRLREAYKQITEKNKK